jgi:hypothetical protein
MGVDATARAEVVHCGVCVELVNGEQFASLSDVDAIQICGHCNRSAHTTVRTGTTPRRTKPIRQPCREPHSTAMTGALDEICGSVHPRLLVCHSNGVTIRSARHRPVEGERPLSCSPMTVRPRVAARQQTETNRLDTGMSPYGGAVRARSNSGSRVAQSIDSLNNSPRYDFSSGQ